jgi:pyruvate dehydrogenase E2 component (dihydrolipoamide acetyltransferase)
MPDILMPKLSDSMEQGTILSWLKTTGETVEIGDEILEIETDKSTVTYAAENSGILETLIDEGTNVAVGEPIARIGDQSAEPQPVVTAPEPRTITESHAPIESQAPIGSSSGIALNPIAAAPTAPSSNGRGQRSAATPLARRTAAVHGLAIDDIQGTGPLGRITQADVLKSAGLETRETSLPAVQPLAAPPSPSVGAAAVSPALSLPAGSTRLQPSRLQQLIARRMADAKATVPHFQVQTEVVMDAAIGFRAELKSLAAEGDAPPSFNDMIIKAAALALREHPLANGSYRDDGFVLHDQINVGMAVAADDALVVPTVFDAVGKSLGQIARESRTLAARVRSNEISPAELEGGTFTVSNLGMFGMTAITPVINPPQAAILGVGALRETLARAEGEIVDRTLLTLTLSCDHRILYGAEASQFLARIRELLEVPLRLVL